MCEQLVARSADPFRLDALWPLAERMERYGLAGFGWGATWLVPGGKLEAHRDTRAFRDDPERDRVGAVETTSVLVHLRRPSKLSTIQLPDAQPFLDPAGRFAFSHNGELDAYRELRERLRLAGRILGRADSEVGERWLEDAWTDGTDAAALLTRLHAELGGVANLAVLPPTARPTITPATARTRCSPSASGRSGSRRRRCTPWTGRCSGSRRGEPRTARWCGRGSW
jgi:hypothetical protein